MFAGSSHLNTLPFRANYMIYNKGVEIRPGSTRHLNLVDRRLGDRVWQRHAVIRGKLEQLIVKLIIDITIVNFG